MGYQVKNDIFISYAHIDNQPLIPGEQGWISDFDYTLKVLLEQLLGEQTSIWRDPKLQGNDYLNDTILDELQNTEFLLPVLSPRYLKSEWCMKELRVFCSAADQRGGISVANKARIFKVVKTPIEPDEHPQELQELTGYEFYHFDRVKNQMLIYDRVLSPEAQRYYLQKLYDLAYAIKDLLKTVDCKECSEDQAEATTGITVYLAETTFDLNKERDEIKRELQQRGYTVLPNQPLPLNTPELQTVVCEHLKHCTLSIHLIGEKYGIVPEGENKSVVDLQNELAAECSQEKPEFSRLIWMPVGLQVKETSQQQFINYLQNNPGTQKGAEILRTSLEDLKTIVQDKLRPQQKSPEQQIAEDGPIRVYLIHDQRDIDLIKPLEDYLFEQNFEVLSPLFEGEQAEVRQYHQDNLRLCDAAIIYYGNANERWLQVQMGELRKAPVYGRSKPMLAKAVYVCSPETPHKQRFQSHEASVIKNFEAFSPDSLEPFLKSLKKK